MALSRQELERFAASERERYERTLKAFVEVPSVSADPARKGEVERCAELGAATIRSFGGRAELHRVAGGNPIVLGSFGETAGRPTVTVYNHLDVQPASRETEPWRSEPFELTREATRTSAAALGARSRTSRPRDSGSRGSSRTTASSRSARRTRSRS